MLPISYQNFSCENKGVLKCVKLTNGYNYDANINIYF